MEQPQANDVILGGQTPPPIASAILGGIVGLQQQLTVASSEQRSQLLPTALNYGEAGIDLLIATLNDDSALSVRATAYQLLQSVELVKSTEAIANGILLNPGDKIYCVLESAITYGDDWYYLRDYVTGSGYYVDKSFNQGVYVKREELLIDSSYLEQDINENHISNHYDYYQSSEEYSSLEEDNYMEPRFDIDGFIYINLQQAESEEQFGYLYQIDDDSEPDWLEDIEDAYYHPKLVSRHVFQETAETIANSLHQELMFNQKTPEIHLFDWWSNFSLNEWCSSNNISLNYPEHNEWGYFDLFLEDLKLQSNHHELLGKLWINSVGRLAFVYEEVIEKPVYFITIIGKL